VLGAGSAPAPSPATAAPARAAADAETTRWQPYAPETVERLRASGQPVFIDFTAAWCLTCQVNERSVLSTTAVREAFAERNVAMVKADWTNRDPAITEALESLGRSGVPVYALYPGDGSGPRLLPEVLTQDIVLNALETIPASSSANASPPSDPSPSNPSPSESGRSSARGRG
jgi:thiol:disulfide interchange protein DsbD